MLVKEKRAICRKCMTLKFIGPGLVWNDFKSECFTFWLIFKCFPLIFPRIFLLFFNFRKVFICCPGHPTKSGMNDATRTSISRCVCTGSVSPKRCPVWHGSPGLFKLPLRRSLPCYGRNWRNPWSYCWIRPVWMTFWSAWDWTPACPSRIIPTAWKCMTSCKSVRSKDCRNGLYG